MPCKSQIARKLIPFSLISSLSLPHHPGRGKPAKKSKAKFQSDNESSGEEWGAKKSSAKKGRKRANDSSDDDSDDDSDYEKPKKKAAPRKKKAPGEKGPRKAGGYTAPVKLSEELADIVGGDEMPRHEVSSDYFLSFP